MPMELEGRSMNFSIAAQGYEFLVYGLGLFDMRIQVVSKNSSANPGHALVLLRV